MGVFNTYLFCKSLAPCHQLLLALITSDHSCAGLRIQATYQKPGSFCEALVHEEVHFRGGGRRGDKMMGGVQKKGSRKSWEKEKEEGKKRKNRAWLCSRCPYSASLGSFFFFFLDSQSKVLREGGEKEKKEERKGTRRHFEYQRIPVGAKPDAEGINESPVQSRMPQLESKPEAGTWMAVLLLQHRFCLPFLDQRTLSVDIKHISLWDTSRRMLYSFLHCRTKIVLNILWKRSKLDRLERLQWKHLLGQTKKRIEGCVKC